MIAAWYVLETKRYAERLAKAHLNQRGLVAYLPLIAEWPRPPVGAEIQPLFPGYVFMWAALAAEIHRARSAPGVKRFVMFGELLAELPASAIDLLREREEADGVIRYRDDATACSRVRITKGPFRGLMAVLERRLSGRARVLVLLEFLGRETRLELPQDWVARQ